MNYFDLTNLQRQHLANQNYLDMAVRNIIQQQRSLDVAREEEDKEGITNISTDFSENIDQLIKFFSTSYLDLKTIPNYMTVINIDQKYLDQRLNFPSEFLSPSMQYSSQLIDKNSNLIFKLESIIDNLKIISDTIGDVGAENFDFSQLKELKKVYDKFYKSYREFINFFEYRGPDDNLIYLGIQIYRAYMGIMSERATIFNNYLEQIVNLSNIVFQSMDNILRLSRERGETKVGYGLKNKDMPKRYL
jgi:hypothetical protein